MPVTLNTSHDFKIWDNCEPARFESVSLSSAMATSLPTAKRRALTTKEMVASNGAYTGADLVWLIPAATVAKDFTAKPRDVVIADREPNAIWTVLEVSLNKFRQTWRLVCRNLAIVYDLRDVITIEQSGLSEDATLAPRRLWTPLFNRLSARVQPQEGAIVDERSIRGQEIKFMIVVERQLPLFDVRECRILCHTPPLKGQYLDIDRYTMAEQIGELPRIEARLKV